jgi:hypothetical protein
MMWWVSCMNLTWIMQPNLVYHIICWKIHIKNLHEDNICSQQSSEIEENKDFLGKMSQNIQK